MGFFSKLWKGIKKVFKKIGKAIKKVTKGIGKFVGKLGIVGQIGMFFIMPHVAGFLMKGLSGAAASLLGTSATGIGGALAKGLGTVLNTAHKFATTAGNVFGTITEGISQFAKTGLSKLGFNIEGAATNFFGNDSAWSRTLDKAGTIFDPFKGAGTSFGDKTLSEFSNQTGISEANLQKLNPELQGLSSDSIVPTDVYTTDVSMLKGIESGISQGQVMGEIGAYKGPLETAVTTPAMDSGISEGYDFDYYSSADIEGVKQTAPAPLAESSLLSPSGVVGSLRKTFETDPLRTTERLLGITQQAQQLGYEEPDVFYGGGAQTQYLYEPSLGYQPVETPQIDYSQGLYGYNAFAQQTYDWSNTSPYLYYMQQQQRYAA